MRINQFVASSAGVSRRQADNLINSGNVKVNGKIALIGQSIKLDDEVTLNNTVLSLKPIELIMLNKPVGFVCSRNSQGSKTVYELLPKKYRHLNSIGRLDKNSSGLLLFTNNGKLANKLTHPKYQKIKTYVVSLSVNPPKEITKSLTDGINLNDGISTFIDAEFLGSKILKVSLAEGKNRQIRRTFEAFGYKVKKLHRTTFGPYELNELGPGEYKEVDNLLE